MRLRSGGGARGDGLHLHLCLAGPVDRWRFEGGGSGAALAGGEEEGGGEERGAGAAGKGQAEFGGWDGWLDCCLKAG